MTLPYLPLRTGDVEKDVHALYTYLYDFLDNFDNSAGSAIDPSMGQGGDNSLTIVDAPTGITYTPNVELTADGTATGIIDITFIKPDRTVDIIIYYREQGTTEFKQSYSSTSPTKLISLKPDVTYQVQLAGQAANGSLGPLSTLTDVTITFSMFIGVPTDLAAVATYQSVVLTWVAPVPSNGLMEYTVQRATDATFTADVVQWTVLATKVVDDTGVVGTLYYYRVRSIDKVGNASAWTAGVSGTTVNVPDDSITYAKIQNVSAASRVLLRGSEAGEGDVEEGTVGSGLSISGTILDTAVITASGTYTPTLVNVANLDATTAYSCQYLRVGGTVTVSGQIDVDPTTAGMATEVRLSLPITSNLANLADCTGVGAAGTAGQETVSIQSDVANNDAAMIWTAGVVVNTGIFFTFTYRII